MELHINSNPIGSNKNLDFGTMNESSARGVTPPSVLRYEHYDYKYDSKNTTSASPLNLLSHAASTVVDQSSTPGTSPTVPPSIPPPVSPPHLEAPTALRIDRSSPNQRPLLNIPPTAPLPPPSIPGIPVGHRVDRLPPTHQPPLFVPPVAFARMPDATSLPQSIPPPLPPSILAMFPQLAPSAHFLPMPPGMEITLDHPHSSPRDTEETKMKSPTNDSKVGGGKASATKAKTMRNPSKYKMKYHYVSMRRWEAHRYIEELARGSAIRYQSPWTATPPMAPDGTFRRASPVMVPPSTRSGPVMVPATNIGYPPVATSVVAPY